MMHELSKYSTREPAASPTAAWSRGEDAHENSRILELAHASNFTSASLIIRWRRRRAFLVTPQRVDGLAQIERPNARNSSQTWTSRLETRRPKQTISIFFFLFLQEPT